MWSLHRLLGVLPVLFLTFDLSLQGKVGPMGVRTATSLSAMLIVAWSSLRGVVCLSAAEVEQHLEMGKKLLAAGQFADALSHYHAAVEGDPNNPLTYFRRATVYLAMGKSKSALPDLDKVLHLKPDFAAARVQRGNVKLKQGKLDEAETDLRVVLEKNPDHSGAQGHIDSLEGIRQDIIDAKDLIEDGQWPEAVEPLSRVIETCPWDPALREMRADCYMHTQEYFKAIGDLKPTTKLRNDNTAAHYKISMIHYQLGEPDESLNEIRECLKLDPDHKDCHPHYKKVKKLVKQMTSILAFINEQKWEECISKAKQMQTTEPDLNLYKMRSKGHICHCKAKDARGKEAIESCNEVLDVYPNDIEALCDRGDAFISDEQWEEAIKDYKEASKINGDLRRVQEGLKRAEKLLKQSQKRDYYKILGVKRNARKKEILKAYRKLAAEWHPDKHLEEDKEAAEKKFFDIASAKEVLTDPEKRQKFDNGEDPLDPEEQQGGGGPWQQGFNPFGSGGGFNFKFNFG